MSIKTFKCFFVIFAILCSQFHITKVSAATNTVEVNIDPSNVLVEREGNNAVGLCLSWVTDSDMYNPDRTYSLKNIISTSNMGTIRWPMGTLAMRYVWNTTDENGNFYYPIKPRMVTPEYFTTNFPWAATDTPGELKDEMDFDEFIEVIKSTNAIPVIDVNCAGDLFAGSTVSYADLKKAAVEQVRYAKEKGITGAYWEIGNEIEDRFNVTAFPDTTAKVTEYIRRYGEFYDAMKAVDPTAQIGVGLNLASNASWDPPIIQGCKEKLDFVVTHQYGGHGYGPVITYENYRDDDKNLDIKIDLISGYIDALGKPYSDHVKILVTEYSPYRSKGWTTPGNVMFKAVHNFEMLGEMVNHPKVVATHFWITRSPWFNNKDDIINADYTKRDTDALNWDGSFTAMGKALAVMSSNLYGSMVSAQSSSFKQKSYASYDKASKSLTVFLLNREDKDATANVTLNNYDGIDSYTHKNVWTFTGKNGLYNDTEYKYEETAAPVMEGNRFSIQLPPVSVTVMKFENKDKDATLSNLILAAEQELVNPIALETVAEGTYSAEVPFRVSNIYVKPTANSNAYSSLSINGTAAQSGVVYGPIALNVGANHIKIIVAAEESRISKNYDVEVKRGIPLTDSTLMDLVVSTDALQNNTVKLEPEFSHERHDYTAVVKTEADSFYIKPTATSPVDRIEVNGVKVSSGMVTAPIIPAGDDDTFIIHVVAENGTYTDYAVKMRGKYRGRDHN